MKRWALTLGVALLALMPAAAAQSPEFYKGKTLKLIVGASVTGGYNAHARVLARHIPKYIPGTPAIIVQNLPAGAGIQATNHVFNLSEKDGTEIGLFNRYTVVAPMLGVEQAKYKVEEFNWLGTTAGYSDNAYLFIVRSSLPIKTIDDLRKANPPLNVGNVGAAPIKVFQEALGLSLKIISGYQGDALDIAFERGEVDGHTVGYQTIISTKPHWVEQKLFRPMIQLGRKDRLPALADVPTGQELVRTPQDKALLDFVEAPLLFGYPFALPPGVPADRVALMRKAFADTMQDSEFKADMTKGALEFSPRNGDDIQALITNLTKIPPDVIARYKAATGDGSREK